MTFAGVVERAVELAPEQGQSAAWMPLDEPWQGWFAEDRLRMLRHVEEVLRG